VTALFGPGDDARRTFISAWLADANARAMPTPVSGTPTVPLKAALVARLRKNTPVLHYLPEAFALLAAPSTTLAGRTIPSLPLLDPRPGVAHAWAVADRAVGPIPDGDAWYARRIAAAGAYAAAELHQLSSPGTAEALLTRLLDAADTAAAVPANMGQFGEYFVRSWRGIFRSVGIF
jgi:ubiquinone biosynthesis protein COQ9